MVYDIDGKVVGSVIWSDCLQRTMIWDGFGQIDGIDRVVIWVLQIMIVIVGLQIGWQIGWLMEYYVFMEGNDYII